MKKKFIISLIVGIIISGIAIYFAFKNVPYADLISYMKSVNYFWVLPSTIVSLTGYIIRVIRWKIIVLAYHPITFWKAYHPLVIAFMLNCILPGRMGEIARPLILKKEEGIPFSTGLATVTAERLFDSILMIICFAVIVAKVNIDPNIDINIGNMHLNKTTLESIFIGILKLCFLIISLIIFIIIEKTRKIIINGINSIPSLLFFANDSLKIKIKNGICSSIIKSIENFAFGFALIKHPAKMISCTILSILTWFLACYSYYVMSFGCPGIHLSFLEMSSVMVIICFFIALPSAPGYWGLWEAGGVFAMALFGVHSKDAAGFTLVNHVIQLFPVIIIGFISLVITGAKIWQISKE